VYHQSPAPLTWRFTFINSIADLLYAYPCTLALKALEERRREKEIFFSSARRQEFEHSTGFAAARDTEN